MRTQLQAESGISLVETMIAMLVLTVGAVGMAATFLQGMRTTGSSPAELVATQKAAEAIESVFSARDTRTISWEQLRNADQQGIFVKNAQPMLVAGDDGILGTGDDGKVGPQTGVIESVVLPGPDQKIGTADDRTETLAGFTREIRISDVAGRQDLRLITVVIQYPAGGTKQKYTLTAYISAVA
jgi:hypothetical protein